MPGAEREWLPSKIESKPEGLKLSGLKSSSLTPLVAPLAPHRVVSLLAHRKAESVIGSGGDAAPEAEPLEQKGIRAGEPEAHRHVLRQRRTSKEAIHD